MHEKGEDFERMAEKITDLENTLEKETKKFNRIQMKLSDSLADTRIKLKKTEQTLEKQ